MVEAPPEWNSASDDHDAGAAQDQFAQKTAPLPARVASIAEMQDTLGSSFDSAAEMFSETPPVQSKDGSPSHFKGDPEESVDTPTEPAKPSEPAPVDDEPILPSADWSSPAAKRMQHLMLIGVSGIVGLVLAVGLFGFIAYRYANSQQTTPSEVAAANDVTPSTGSKVSKSAPVETAKVPTESEPTEKTIDPSKPTTDSISKVDPIESTEVHPMATTDDPPMTKTTDEPPGLTPITGDIDDTTIVDPDKLLEGLGDFSKLLNDEPFDAGVASDEPFKTEPLPGEEGVAKTHLRPAPRNVDVAERLADPIPAIEFPETPLAELLQVLSDISTIPITIDPDALAQVNVTPATRLRIRQNDTTIGDILSGMLAPIGLGVVASEGHVLVTRPAPQSGSPRQATYSIADLVADDTELRMIGEMLTAVVANGTWRPDGDGQLKFEDKALVVQHSESVHFQTLVFCEKLRVARGLKPRSKYDPSLFELTSRTERAAARLETPISLNFVQSTRFLNILHRIQQEADVHLLVDWQALATAEWNPDGETILSVDGKPLRESLTTLLEPMDLTFRIVDASTIQITTPQALAAHIDLEFYPASDLIEDGMDGKMLLDRLRSSLGVLPENDRSAIRLDVKSKTLLVAVSPPQHVTISSLLERLKRAK